MQLGGGHRFAALRRRYEGSWPQDVVRQLRVLDLGAWTVVFGAELLWSVLPFIILLSSLANERVDDDLSRHIGASGQGVRVIRGYSAIRPPLRSFRS